MGSADILAAQEDSMTDIATIAAATIRRLKLPRPNSPGLSFSASLSAMFGAMGEAHRMALVDPYTGLRRQQQFIPDDDLKGRNPNW
jgi:hypothetical protein